ncbi:hypothetical protein DFR46_1868 [Parasphingopyxis lamellibrachiae]|uniref:Uncharacterized protein n=1 Tax=Parasphingopyxis lamellibrachiae TaxID=680125 RepID=A0A3D9FIC3_9SPHN|nr:hypothetical protein DFR46_1868 [Parasphingopyxis lamellibrachiae]
MFHDTSSVKKERALGPPSKKPLRRLLFGPRVLKAVFWLVAIGYRLYRLGAKLLEILG